MNDRDLFALEGAEKLEQNAAAQPKYIYMILKHFQGCWLHHLSRRHFSSSLVQLEAVPSLPITITWEKKLTPTLPQPPFR